MPRTVEAVAVRGVHLRRGHSGEAPPSETFGRGARSVRSRPEDIRHEDEIVWTEDVDSFDYVRETLVDGVGTRRRPVSWRGQVGRRVGYAVLKKDAPSNQDAPGMFARRVFWVKEHDRSEQPDGAYSSGAPTEAVDPRTVAPGVCGELTERAWGGPLARDVPSPKKRPAAKYPPERAGRSQTSPTDGSVSKTPAAIEQGSRKLLLSGCTSAR
ncbi:DUF6009 family protein [Streptomyces sp. NPDC047434]|uniref:DUF6009 family protein n=1 Tax=Streptomyces sp. NPDC047434 TaxID=3155143 RepID=UPI0034066922